MRAVSTWDSASLAVRTAFPSYAEVVGAGATQLASAGEVSASAASSAAANGRPLTRSPRRLGVRVTCHWFARTLAHGSAPWRSTTSASAATRTPNSTHATRSARPSVTAELFPDDHNANQGGVPGTGRPGLPSDGR